VSFAPNPMSWSLKFDETIAFSKGKALMAVFATVVAKMDHSCPFGFRHAVFASRPRPRFISAWAPSSAAA